jgi:hypothetical protein
MPKCHLTCPVGKAKARRGVRSSDVIWPHQQGAAIAAPGKFKSERQKADVGLTPTNTSTQSKVLVESYTGCFRRHRECLSAFPVMTAFSRVAAVRRFVLLGHGAALVSAERATCTARRHRGYD